jgi:hydroxypyruvate isomerase
MNSGKTPGKTGLWGRRDVLKTTAGTTAAGLAAAAVSWVRAADVPTPSAERIVAKGRVNQSLCAWCFKKWFSLEQLAQLAAAMGLKSVELLGPNDFPLLKKYGLVCAMVTSHPLAKGFADKANHQMCIEALKKAIDACAEAGFPNVITFSGNRNKIPDDVGLDNAVDGLKKIIGYAEQKKVNLCIEVLNSRLNHPDYMCDTVEWAAELCRRVASPRMKMLFDIYHVQVQQGDVIARIRKFHEYIGHYHTAGVPGRNELDENQELYYPAIMRAIVETGFSGYVGQEFIPTRDPLQSLREAVRICDV